MQRKPIFHRSRSVTLIYTRMGTVFRCETEHQEQLGVRAKGEFSTHPGEQKSVFLPWSSVDVIEYQ